MYTYSRNSISLSRIAGRAFVFFLSMFLYFVFVRVFAYIYQAQEMPQQQDSGRWPPQCVPMSLPKTKTVSGLPKQMLKYMEKKQLVVASISLSETFVRIETFVMVILSTVNAFYD